MMHPLLDNNWRSDGLASDCSLFSRSHTWLASSQELHSRQNQLFSGGGLRKVSIWLEERGCVYECVCACVCMPQTLGGLSVQAQACPVRHKWKMMAAAQPRSKEGYSPVLLMKTNAQITVTQRLWHMIQPRFLVLFLLQNPCFNHPERGRWGHKERGSYLKEELLPIVIDAGDPWQT